MSLVTLGKDARFAFGIATGKPFQVLVQVTNRCNMRCSFCDFWPNGVPPAQELTAADYRKLAGELAQEGTFLVSVEGGEPTLRPDLVEIVAAFAERHHPVLYTNGWHVTPELARSLFGAGLTQVGVSIDFSDPIRHDAKRGLAGAFERAWNAIDVFKAAAPKGARQVHVMTVLMRDNQHDLERQLERSRDAGVGHMLTLLSKNGYRRADGVDDWPAAGIGKDLTRLYARFPHFRVFSRYLDGIDAFLEKRDDLPGCQAGERSFNVDHVGNVSPCIEKIDRAFGNVRAEPLTEILARMKRLDEVRACQQCWTLCRGFNQAFAGGGTVASWRELGTRVRA